jgi:DNA-binding transcriptional ArsR family regulator
MVERLARGPASVKQLAEPLPMSLPAVMQHLAVLEASGLVRTEKTGRVRTCTLEPEALVRAQDWFKEQRSHWERRFDRLEEYLKDNDSEAK